MIVANEKVQVHHQLTRMKKNQRQQFERFIKEFVGTFVAWIALNFWTHVRDLKFHAPQSGYPRNVKSRKQSLRFSSKVYDSVT
ncbi:CLUMA_CG010577, isoform A [Clunio marinus]|uniref:CLUMA_CG010577, isoform A n=1 Tax=Clunio marinus TaxID=568069 RepID=A0A1J1ICA3_9DIPT|nr:CLUMA_CG010577, isoform A [Clunio marinus]